MIMMVEDRVSPGKKLVHPEFGKRLERACDGNPDVPPLNHGRLGWFVEQLTKHNVDVSVETVRKWFAGETRPRHRPMTALAQILKVDELWLSSGKAPEFTESQRRQNNVVAGGAVNVVAGFIQMDGGHPAFPLDNDQDALNNKIHLYSIIRGASYRFHIVTALGEGEDRHFVVPHDARNTIILGLVPGDKPFSVTIYELPWEMIEEAGSRRSNGFDVKLDGPAWRKIKSFAERL
jgi:transcriptional regulator with XRE-family HTH domain